MVIKDWVLTYVDPEMQGNSENDYETHLVRSQVLTMNATILDVFEDISQRLHINWTFLAFEAGILTVLVALVVIYALNLARNPEDFRYWNNL